MTSTFRVADWWIGRIEMALTVVLLVLLVALTAVGVLFRYVLGNPLGWGVDLAIVALVWLTFIGAAAVYRENGHIAASTIPEILVPPWSTMVAAVIAAATALSLAVLGWYGYRMAAVQHGQTITTLDLPRSIYSAPVVWAAVSMGFHLLVRLLILGAERAGRRSDV